MLGKINVYGYMVTPKQANEYIKEHDKLLERLSKKWGVDNECLKCYLVATDTAYTVLCNANHEGEAIRKAKDYYLEEYKEERDDWVAYEITSWLKSIPEGVVSIRTWAD